MTGYGGVNSNRNSLPNIQKKERVFEYRLRLCYTVVDDIFLMVENDK